jgi:toxin ParE1/3/4
MPAGTTGNLKKVNYKNIFSNYVASKVKSHLIFYRILVKEIEVIRVLYEWMDIERRLNNQ